MRVRPARSGDVPGMVALQRACFPAPFPAEFLWRVEHLERHLEIFPAGQFVAVEGERVVGSASNSRISEADWQAHLPWDSTVGGPFLQSFNPAGSTLYGLDISVHPEYRGRGVGRALYEARFNLVRELRLLRFGTACRLPGYLNWSKTRTEASVETYVQEVVAGREADRTLTPLLRYGLEFIEVLHGYMEDPESADSAALLEWKA